MFGIDTGGNSVPFPTWADVNNGFLDKVGPGAFSNENANSYTFTSRGVLALVTDLPNGLANWTWLDGALAAWRGGLAYDGRYAFVPSQHIVGDINNDGSVDVVDLLYLVDTFGMVFGDATYNPAADFNGDFSIDVVDLLTFVENFGL